MNIEISLKGFLSLSLSRSLVLSEGSVVQGIQVLNWFVFFLLLLLLLLCILSFICILLSVPFLLRWLLSLVAIFMRF